MSASATAFMIFGVVFLWGGLAFFLSIALKKQ